MEDTCIGDNSFVNETHCYYCFKDGTNYKSVNDTHCDHCPRDGTYYNHMATLMFNSQEKAIEQLFHGNGVCVCVCVCMCKDGSIGAAGAAEAAMVAPLFS